MKQKFFDEGHTVPKCVNPGCDRECVARNWGNWSFKSECSRCMTARKEKRYVVRDGLKYITHRGKEIGIVIHKKDYCENHDGHLGFVCPVPRDGWARFQSGLDLDHKNGDHYSNNPEDVETLCKLCHGLKSIVKGDCSSHKDSARTFNTI
jgi:hypothetical protein